MTTEHNFTQIYCNYSFQGSNQTDCSEGSVRIHIADFVIIILYLILSIALGLYLSMKHKTASDYFLASRSTKWPLVGLSLFASNISSTTLIGLSGDAYSTGISVYNYEWFAAIVLIFIAVVCIPNMLEMELFTMPEFLEKRYNAGTRYYFSVLTIFLNIAGGVAGSLYAGALVLKMIFPKLELWHTIAILAVIAGVYTITGGLKAVIYTDALQAVILLFGSSMISVYALIEAGGWQAVREQVPPDFISLVRPIDDPAVPWTGLITGLPLLGLFYWCFNQTIAQRVLSSKDVSHGRIGCLLAGLLKLPVLFIMVLPGTMAKVIYPNLPKADFVYPILLLRLLPAGALGIVLSGFLAALMSQVDSILNSTATLVTMDFVKKFKPDLNDAQLMNIGKFVTFLCMLISVCWAPFLGRVDSLFKFLQKLLSYLIPPVMSLFLGGFFWKGANSRGAILALSLGNVWGIALFVINEVLDMFHIHFLHVAAILFVLSFLVLVGASLVTDGSNTEDQVKVVWSSEKFVDDIKSTKQVPLWKNYLVHCLLLTLITVVIVGCFW
ncbi:sodium/mannose cotransporter SLC5A10-like [Macrobrachium rosenbergii]|uniref:sodium/mannose cotransporter SLC5A10-like n=1 Tax=Macrobrachium rosenbergii TaxID=79674 RepID=UPI0034D3B501